MAQHLKAVAAAGGSGGRDGGCSPCLQSQHCVSSRPVWSTELVLGQTARLHRETLCLEVCVWGTLLLFLEDWSSVASTFGQLTPTCNSSSKDPTPSSDLCGT